MIRVVRVNSSRLAGSVVLVSLIGVVSLVSACREPPPERKAVRADEERDAERAALALAAEADRAPPAEPEPAEAIAGPHTEIGSDRGVCRRTLCFAGEGALDQSPNRDLGEMCRRAAGTVRDCDGERCSSVWPSERWREGFGALIESMDKNGDGKVDEQDPPCLITAAGWSGGAVIASQTFPELLTRDARVSAARAVIERLVLIAPYAPGYDQLTIPDSVANAWIYRHSKNPEGDCSRAYEEGPWLSPAPVCGEHTQCWDYDYSLEPALAYRGRHGARAGPEVGHCSVVPIVARVGVVNLNKGLEAFSEMLPRLSNGETAGRAHPEPPADPADSAPQH